MLEFLAPSCGRCDEPLPRLEGIVVGLHERFALFVQRGGAHAVAVLREGTVIGPYTVEVIDPDKVVVVGPAGVETLVPEPDADHLDSGPRATPGLPSLEAETMSAGIAIGGLAMRRDNCVRSGLLPGVAIGAEKQLTAMIAAMSNLPVRDGEAGARDAPVKMLASALSAGLEAARRQARDRDVDAGGCAKVEARWLSSAPRYGLH